MTPGAISRRLQGLEERLGAALFHRHHKRVELTPIGRQFLADVTGPLEQLAAATARMTEAAGSKSVSVCVYPTFAFRWLIPRWSRFYDRHPDVDVQMTTSLNPVDFRSDGYDLAIDVDDGRRATGGLTAKLLAEVDLFPVCSPAVARRLRCPADLAEQTLLHGAPRPDDWPRWLETANVAGVDATSGLNFGSSNLALQAALEGLGVAIGIELLIRDELAQGRLVKPFQHTRRSGNPFQLIYPTAKHDHLGLQLFRDWLLEEAGRGVGDPGPHVTT